MKTLIVAAVCVAVALGQSRIQSKLSTRNVPANVGKDNPNACLSVTEGKAFQVGQTWALPICGKSTCFKDGDKLSEKVEDCGPLPKQSPGCKIVNEADKNKPYPTCCPVYECQPGSALQYPTEAEIKAAADRAAQAAPPPTTQGAPGAQSTPAAPGGQAPPVTQAAPSPHSAPGAHASQAAQTPQPTTSGPGTSTTPGGRS
ncbi:uncharacterized protein LOC135223082 [Macrobrachium nipponense]|uniref:uncharacterized protein LOC135223082 n=1 Tax=Macrobrachium nipponense TaxID=159736 RepID=UPI0030C867B9